MIKKDPIIYLLHIRESIRRIDGYISRRTKRDLSSSLELQDALVRRLEIIGEAVSKLSPAFRKKYQLVPWRQVADMRNFLIHEYFGVDLEIVWKTIKDDLPKFKKQIDKIIKANRQKVMKIK